MNDNENMLYLPLEFWINTNGGLALPFVHLQYHEVKINVDTKLIHDLNMKLKSSYWQLREYKKFILSIDYIESDILTEFIETFIINEGL